MKARALAAILAVLLTGCVLKRSTPPRLYLLQASAPASSPAPAPAAGGTPHVLGVQRVSVPAWMDRPEIVAHAGGDEIAADPLARWGEPITRGIQRVVAENLAARLPDHHLVEAPFATGSVDHRLDLAITEGARQADGSVLLEARWAILGPGGVVVVQRRSSHRKPAGASAEAAVHALSEALASLSEEIAAAVRTLG
jgi:uncharacterized lipoprotein YmbA